MQLSLWSYKGSYANVSPWKRTQHSVFIKHKNFLLILWFIILRKIRGEGYLRRASRIQNWSNFQVWMLTWLADARNYFSPLPPLFFSFFFFLSLSVMLSIMELPSWQHNSISVLPQGQRGKRGCKWLPWGSSVSPCAVVVIGFVSLTFWGLQCSSVWFDGSLTGSLGILGTLQQKLAVI